MKTGKNRDLMKIAIISAATAVALAAIPGNRSSAAAATAISGGESRSLYRQHCSRCHGADGHANTREGRRTEADDLTEDSVRSMPVERMTRIIRNGKGDMPGFGKKLNAAQIASLVRYVKSL